MISSSDRITMHVRFLKKKMLVWVEFAASVGIYIVLTHVAMLSALANPTVHDIFSFAVDDVYVWYAAIMFPVIPLAWRAYKGITVRWVGQLSRIILLKAILQFVTVVPAPSGMRDCDPDAVFWIFSCANMMFSGPTALTMLALQGLDQRWILVTLQSVLVLLAGVHYASDCIVATVAVSYVESLSITVGNLNGNVTPLRSYFEKFRERAARRVSSKTRVYEPVGQRERVQSPKGSTAAGHLSNEYGLGTP